METIKKSFVKTFLPSVVAAIAVIILSHIFWHFGNFGQLAILITAPPVYAGFYGYLFKRIDGKKPGILSLFDCCRGVGSFFKSLVMVGLRGFVAKILSLCVLFFCASSGLRNPHFFENGGITVNFVLSVLADICSLFFLFMPYLYVIDRNIGVSAALKKSARLALKYLLVFIALRIAALLPSIIHVAVSFILDPDFDFKGFMEYLQLTYPNFAIELPSTDIIIKAFSIWAEFTAVYIIFERERENMLKDFFSKFKKDIDTSDETAEETPFIEPYDFYIEADERYNDEKTVETENIRGIDILEIFDGMELADDVRVDTVIRKKLKRMFDDLAFEIGEYVTYQGGKEIGDEFSEEIDDREFKVSVKITKSSDSAPFILTLSVSSEE